MLTIKYDGEKLAEVLDELGPEVTAILASKVEQWTNELQRHIVYDKLAGQVLNQKTGALARSIQAEAPLTDGDRIYGRVFSAGDVKYAAIHEYGGTIEHPGGTAYFPTAAGAMRYISNSAADALEAAGHVLPRTKPHDINMPERSFMRTSLAEVAPKFALDLKQALVERVTGSVGGGNR